MFLKNIRLVTFDATNTLLRFKVHPWQYYTTVGREYGFEGSNDDLKPRLLDSYKEMWNKYPNFGKNLITWNDWWSQVVKKTFHGNLPENANVDCLANKLINDFKTNKCWCLAEGSEKILNILKKNGIFIGVISNFDPRLVEILQNLNIYNNFDFVLNSFDAGFTKPDKKIFEYAIMKINQNVQPNECVHIGDDIEKDYTAARNAGWYGLLISNKTNIGKNIHVKHIFCNLNDLYDTIVNNKLIL